VKWLIHVLEYGHFNTDYLHEYKLSYIRLYLKIVLFENIGIGRYLLCPHPSPLSFFTHLEDCHNE